MHIVYALSPGGGPEAYVRTMSPWLAARGHRVSVVSGASFASPFAARVRVARATRAHYYLARLVGRFRAWPLRLRAWEQSAAVARAVRGIDALEPVDLVEVTEGLPVEALVRRWPVVVRAHGSDWSFRHFCQDGNCRDDRHLVRMEAAQLREADATAALSTQLADHLAKFCEFPRERIQVIPYAIDLAQFAPAAQAGAPRAFGAEPVILSIGRLEKRKGTDVLVKAMNTVWETFPGARLHLLGGATQFTPGELLELVPAAKREQLIFPGFVARADLPGRYQAASLYVTATQYETFAYTVLEALATGLPVVASRTGAVPELIEDGQNGVLLPPGDPRALGERVTALLGDPARMARLGSAARQSAGQYALARVGPLHEALYASAVETHAHRAR